jgi:hypothetical protein
VDQKRRKPNSGLLAGSIGCPTYNQFETELQQFRETVKRGTKAYEDDSENGLGGIGRREYGGNRRRAID